MFRSDCCPSVHICLTRVLKVFVAVSKFLLAWFEMHWQLSQAIHQTHYVCFHFSYKRYLWNRSFFSPFSSFISVQQSLITLLLGKFRTKLVQHGAESGGRSWADTNCALCCYLFGGRREAFGWQHIQQKDRFSKTMCKALAGLFFLVLNSHTCWMTKHIHYP